MKMSSEVLLFSCLLLLTSFQVIKAFPVLDTNKEEVRPGYNYYILPATTAIGGGGLTLAKGKNGSCPLDVFQEQNSKNNGLPVKFLMVNSSAGLVIYENEDVNIKFSAPNYVSICNKSIVWKVEDGFVTTGGIKGGSINGTATSLFTIQKYEDAYALQYCPRATGCSFICPRLLCGFIGIDQVNGTGRLAVNRRNFKIVFKKA